MFQIKHKDVNLIEDILVKRVITRMRRIDIRDIKCLKELHICACIIVHMT